MQGTRVETISGGKWISETHSNHYRRYFNGQRYYVVETHSFMSSWDTWDGHTMYWLHFVRYISLDNKTYRKVSFSRRSVPMSGPSISQRTIDALIPDDIQTIPF